MKHGGRVDGYLVRTCVKEPCGILERGDSSADSERNVNPFRNPRDQFRESPATFGRCADVKIDKLVSALERVESPHLHRVSNLAKPLEIDSFDHLPVFHVKARYNSFGQHIT